MHGRAVMGNSGIRYLEQREKRLTRTLYEAAFPEDSKAFTDYYYEWKMIDNRIIVMEGAKKDGSFHVMVHMNPYRLWINGSICEVPYIVAVATDGRYRRQGKMGQVMSHALRDMGQGQLPFTFLLPADPAYYRGLGFVFFPCQDYLDRGGICFGGSASQGSLRAASAGAFEGAVGGEGVILDGTVGGGAAGFCRSMRKSEWRYAREEDFEKMASFSNKVLRDRCEVYIRRDSGYYRRLLRELASEHGGALLAHSGQELCGALLYSLGGREEGKTAEIKELLLKGSVFAVEAEQICRDALELAGCAVQRITFAKSRMMVRLTNLWALVPLLRSQRRKELFVEVLDPVIDANNGCFHIVLDNGRSSISRIAGGSARRRMDIGELAETLFKDTSVYLNEWV